MESTVPLVPAGKGCGHDSVVDFDGGPGVVTQRHAVLKTGTAGTYH